jgi:hypothetical protein
VVVPVLSARQPVSLHLGLQRKAFAARGFVQHGAPVGRPARQHQTQTLQPCEVDRAIAREPVARHRHQVSAGGGQQLFIRTGGFAEAEQHGHVHTAGVQQRVELAALAFANIQADQRVLGLQAQVQPGDQRVRGRGQDGQPHLAHGQAGVGADVGQQLVGVAHPAAHPGLHALAQLGQCNAAPGAAEQRAAAGRLQLADLAADVRLHRVALGRGLGEAAEFGHFRNRRKSAGLGWAWAH